MTVMVVVVVTVLVVVLAASVDVVVNVVVNSWVVDAGAGRRVLVIVWVAKAGIVTVERGKTLVEVFVVTTLVRVVTTSTRTSQVMDVGKVVFFVVVGPGSTKRASRAGLVIGG